MGVWPRGEGTGWATPEAFSLAAELGVPGLIPTNTLHCGAPKPQVLVKDKPCEW